LLGFEFEDTTVATELISSNLYNLSGVQMLYIAVPSLNISSVTSKNGDINNIIQDINIETLTGTAQSFKNNSQIRYKVQNTIISNIDVNIYDENNELVNFNNTDFFLNISLIFSYKTEYKPDITLDLKSGQTTDINPVDEQK
jgi:hypothetical protein